MKHSFFLAAAILFFYNAKSQDNPPAVTIGSQTWMVKNLDVDHYQNGDPIPEVKDHEEWFKLTTGAWCYYNNDPANGKIYGKLYNWYAVNDPRGLAPKGWHVPVFDEWVALSTALGGDRVAGGKMKEPGFTHWESPNTGAINSSGFLSLPGGARYRRAFSGISIISYWWSSTEYSPANARYIYLYYNDDIITRYGSIKQLGLSVRCLRD